MTDSILVRVLLGAFDYMHPSEQHTQVVVQIPGARASYLLPGGLFDGLKGRAWPEVVDVAHEHYVQSWAVGDRVSETARAAVHEWLREDANRDEMYAAWEQDQARRYPVARKLLKENEQLRARVAELEALAGSATEFRVWEPGYGLCVRRAPGADGSGFAILEARSSDKGRRAWTATGWQYSAVLAGEELFCWPDAQTAVAEARRIMPGTEVREAGEGS
ncbi:hypothetical protein [Streptomyces sp. enrichment culture]|uniref:hypothetical protein n=1 Tax=Streptomyces sp. enrichment culture TaxID=1795815 RepID=UPI003F544D7D